jgi:hypothetical protein
VLLIVHVDCPKAGGDVARRKKINGARNAA